MNPRIQIRAYIWHGSRSIICIGNVDAICSQHLQQQFGILFFKNYDLDFRICHLLYVLCRSGYLKTTRNWRIRFRNNYYEATVLKVTVKVLYVQYFQWFPVLFFQNVTEIWTKVSGFLTPYVSENQTHISLNFRQVRISNIWISYIYCMYYVIVQ